MTPPIGALRSARPFIPDITIVDDFEDNDLSEYTITNSSTGDHHTTSTTQVYNGTYSCQCGHNDTNPKALSTSGLNAYPSAGDTFHSWHRMDDVTNKTQIMSFAVQSISDSPDAYNVHISERDGQVELAKISSGSHTSLATESNTWNDDTWYEMIVDWGSSGTIEVEIKDINGNNVAGPISATDTDYTSGGIGLVVGDTNTSSDNGHFWDYIYIE